ncbi:MAG TPA: hypothetical protein VMG40_09120 [Bryobacteraceae bacterium]|nr:hypothetical protein [Bryobacteraceae bacterium]
MALALFGAGALALHAWRLQMKLFGRTLSFRLDRSGQRKADEESFAEFVAAIADAPIHRDSRFAVETNGEIFFPALRAIAAARRTVSKCTNSLGATFQTGSWRPRSKGSRRSRSPAGD